MIIPIKCFTCGKVLANKYLYYISKVREIKASEGSVIDVVYFTDTNTKKTPEAHVMDELGLVKICCRRHMLSHVDIE